MVEKGIRGEICHSISKYAKTNNKYMKDYDKNKESSYLQYWDVSNLCGWAMLQILSGSKILLNLMKISSKTIMKKVMNDILSKLMFIILKNYMNFIMIYHFYQKE